MNQDMLKELLRKPYETTQPAFYFTVQFPGEGIHPEAKPDIVSLEISGIATEITTETIEEGGVNSHVHVVPKSIKHGNLVLKKSLIARESSLADWCAKTLQGDLSAGIECKTIQVQLKNDKDEVLLMWLFKDAYPATWTVDEFNSTHDTIVIESMEFSYTFSTREKL